MAGKRRDVKLAVLRALATNEQTLFGLDVVDNNTYKLYTWILNRNPCCSLFPANFQPAPYLHYESEALERRIVYEYHCTLILHS